MQDLTMSADSPSRMNSIVCSRIFQPEELASKLLLSRFSVFMATIPLYLLSLLGPSVVRLHAAQYPTTGPDVGAFTFRGLGGLYYTIYFLRNPPKPLVILQAPHYPAMRTASGCPELPKALAVLKP